MTSREKAFTKKHRRSPKVATFVELHAHEPPLERPHAADGASRPAISLSGSGTRRRAPVRVPSGQKLANEKSDSTSKGRGGGSRRWMRVAARHARQTERSLARSSTRGRRPTTTPRMSHGRCCGSSASSGLCVSEARAHFVEHLVCAAFAAVAASDSDALPPLRTQTGRCVC
jgi:hypothetical protein